MSVVRTKCPTCGKPDCASFLYRQRRAGTPVGMRTIIEINHDHLGRHSDSVEVFDWFLQWLEANGGGAVAEEFEPLIRVLGERHHSEPEWKQSK